MPYGGPPTRPSCGTPTLGLPTSPRVFSTDVRYPAELLEAGRELLDGETARLGLVGQRVEVSSELVHYPPAAALVEEIELAELLVLGCRRRRVLPRLIHASVPEQCANAAHCPVVVVGSGYAGRRLTVATMTG
jgi:nucleotide-binding universal stress UspA family protein